MFLRQFYLDRIDRAAILRTVAPARRPHRCRFRRADGPQGLAVTEGKTDKGVQEQDARGLVQDHGRLRHLLRADPDHGRGAETSAHGSARRLRRASRRDATSPGAALLAYAVGDQGHGDSGYWRTDE